MPLFTWPVRSEIDALEAERRSLKARIDAMRTRSQRRVGLERELYDLTLKQLRLYARLNGNR
jgi:hypothetical protein